MKSTPFFRQLRCLLPVLSTVLLASAGALPVSLDIDFRDTTWSPATGQTQYVVSGTTASGQQQTLLGVRSANLRWSSTFGLGVDSSVFGEDRGEVGPFEILNVSFSSGAGNNLTGAYVSKLFREGFGGLTSDRGIVQLFDESAALIDTITFTGLQTSSQNTLGDLFIDFGGPLDLSKAIFYGVGTPLVNRDYAVAGFVKQVPEGGQTVALLGIALLGLAAVRSRFSGVRA